MWRGESTGAGWARPTPARPSVSQHGDARTHPGAPLHLAGEDAPRGAHLENLILTDLIAWRDGRSDGAQLLFWRTHPGEEVDFVIEPAGRLLPIEVQAAARVSTQDAPHLKTFREQYHDTAHGGLILHSGTDVVWAARDVLAAPWWRVL
jgi:predicted AAA+ superfamily ATPase